MKIHFRAFDGPSDWGWVNTQIPILRVEDTCGIMAIDADTNETLGACIMDNWTTNSVQAHFMATTPMLLKHGFIEECFDYLFNERELKYIYGMVPEDNVRALKLNKHMGFTEKLRLPDAWADGIDYVVMELKKENCKYLPQLAAA
jgi:hypothetical protein